MASGERPRVIAPFVFNVALFQCPGDSGSLEGELPGRRAEPVGLDAEPGAQQQFDELPPGIPLASARRAPVRHRTPLYIQLERLATRRRSVQPVLPQTQQLRTLETLSNDRIGSLCVDAGTVWTFSGCFTLTLRLDWKNGNNNYSKFHFVVSFIVSIGRMYFELASCCHLSF